MDTVWTLPVGQMEITYKAVRVPPRADVRVEYSIRMMEAQIQREDSSSTIAKDSLRQGLVSRALREI